MTVEQGVRSFGVPGPHWKKKSCLELPIKHAVTRHHRTSQNVLSTFTISCGAAAILGRMRLTGRGLDTPARASLGLAAGRDLGIICSNCHGLQMKKMRGEVVPPGSPCVHWAGIWVETVFRDPGTPTLTPSSPRS